MKDVATPVPPAEVRGVIKKCLENAALVNYERLSEQARLEAEAKNKQGKFLDDEMTCRVNINNPLCFYRFSPPVFCRRSYRRGRGSAFTQTGRSHPPL